MPSTRREFIKELGIALASLVTARCAPQTPGREAPTPTPTLVMLCYKETVIVSVEPTPSGQLIRQADILTATATGSNLDPAATRQALAAIARERLRGSWQQFDELGAETRTDADRGTKMQELLVADHRAALDDLVAREELSETIAGRVQVAFEAAAYHTWRANAPITCYEPVLINYKPVSSDQLVKQAEVLAERDDLDPQVSAQAQEAIARDIAFLNLSAAQVDALYQEILNGQQVDRPTPAFEEVDLDVSLEDLEAARFLVGLLLRGAP